MHPNATFAWQDREEMLAFVAERAFCTLFAAGPEGLTAVHLPVVIYAPDRIRFHLSRANRAVRSDSLSGRALLSCLGPDAYISPDWYGTPDQVPTWNYLAVEMEGPLRRLDEEEIADQLDRLSADHEERLLPKLPWTRGKMTPGRFEAMIKGIHGYEMTVEEMRGTRKFGQHKKPEEIEGVVNGLKAAGQAELAAMTEALSRGRERVG